MATYVNRNGRWLAKVVRRPHKPMAKTFGTLHEARAWAENLEASLRQLKTRPDLIFGPPAPKPDDPHGFVSALPRLDFEASSVGIYFLFKNNRCVYVGQSIKVHQRVTEHRTRKAHLKDFDSYSWVTCRRDQLSELERFYIEKLNPKLNTTFTERNVIIARDRARARARKPPPAL